jgi:glyoxylase-like metal-dependent hydrolase (beta-lactamase superfamily II)
VGGVVVAHSADQPVIENVDIVRSGANLYRMTYEPCPVGLAMSEEQKKLVVGDVSLHLLHIPGHTPGSICAWFELEGERVLFAQDLHGPVHSDWGSDRIAWRSSLKKMLSLEADLLCEGHFGVVYGQEQVKNFIKEYLFR